MMAKKIKITLVRSVIGQKPDIKATVRSLGLKKINSSVIKEDSASMRGMANVVSHLVKIEEAD